MSTQYITTNVRLPKSLHKTLKRRALENDKSLAELIRDALNTYAPHKPKSPKRIKTFDALRKLAEPMGGDLSSNIDEIVYGKHSD